LSSWQIGIAIRAAGSGHLPNYGFVFVTLGSTAVLLITFRALLYTVLPVDNTKKSDDYRRGSPFELFEVNKFFICQILRVLYFLTQLPLYKHELCYISVTSAVSMNLCMLPYRINFVNGEMLN